MSQDQYDFKPIDEHEGPTLWARRDGPSTLKVASGQSPTEPMDEMWLSENDVKRLGDMFDDRD